MQTKKDAPVACIIGDNEFKDKQLLFWNLLAKKFDNNQITIKKENLINEIKNLSKKIKSVKSKDLRDMLRFLIVIETNNFEKVWRKV